MKLLCGLFFTVLSINTIQAQIKTKHKLDDLVSEYSYLYETSQNLVAGISQYKFVERDDLLSSFLEYSENFVVKDNIKNVSTKYNSSDLGLKFITDYNHNFGIGDSNDENIIYKSRVSTGLDWDLFGSNSFFTSKKERISNELEFKKDSLELFLMNDSDKFKKQKENLKIIFDFHRLEVLKNYAIFYRQKVDYANKLYDSGLIIYAEKLKNEHVLEKISNQISLLEDNLSDTDFVQLLNEFKELPFTNINLFFNKSKQGFTYNTLNKEILELQKTLLENKFTNTEKINFRTKFRYNFYNSDGSFQRNFASIGASLTIPLNFGKNGKTLYQIENLKTKIKLQDKVANEQFKNLENNFKITHNELLELLNYSEYLNALFENEKVILEKYPKNFSPDKSLEYSIQLVQNKLKILDLQQSLFEYYFNYQLLFKSNQNTARSREQFNSTYLWNDTFDEYSNSHLIRVLQQNKINNVLLSASKSDKEKLIDFKNQTQKKGIKISRLISENSYALDESGLQKLLIKIQNVDTLIFSGIHLNIEPHTFDDYKENKLKYISNMNLIYEKTHAWCQAHNLEFSVSIPMHLPKENYDLLSKIKVKTFIMAYENVDQVKLLNRTDELRKALKKHFVWVLRVNDFKNDALLNKALLELRQNGVNDVGFYDLSSLLKRKK